MEEPSSPPLPASLFKYRRLGSEDDLKPLRDLIVERRMWWASPVKFNDPFDCAPAFRFPTGRKLSSAMMRLERKHNPLGSRADRREFRKKAIANGRYRYEQEFRASIRGLMAESAVYSLGSHPDSILMWSHYANSHKGVCLRFDTALLTERFKLFAKVKYSPERPEVLIDQEEDPETIFEKVMATKSCVWEYEDEYRLLAYREKEGLRELPKGCLNGVIFGMNSTESDQKTLLQYIDELDWPVAVYRAEQNPRLFEINLIPENGIAKQEALRQQHRPRR